ncbi:MAG: tRNA pseudouridine(38-40) synthase TruA [Deltaproteobacteria bacterium]|jgi:tRNA pseudouridine38-40 synthase|nr:tRNA pseudouridine(38-40) synthase TruA [Deltaproteobacteria bacterium]
MDLENTGTKRNVKLTLSYDGTGFNGWQRQAKGLTLQGILEEALEKVCAHPVTVYGSGRTDAGVHARAQVANFFTGGNRSPAEILKGGNAILPQAMAIVAASEVPSDFNARFSAKGKTYSYDFLTSRVRDPLLVDRAWLVGPNLDWGAIDLALPSLLGEKDFAAFKSAGDELRSTVRIIREAFITEPTEGLRRLTLTGSGFMRHMVRTIAGTLWQIGRSKLTPAGLESLFEARDRSKAGPTAPAHGLYLDRVHY